MCLQVTYTLICEHVRTQTVYCANATFSSEQPVSAPSSRKSSGSSKNAARLSFRPQPGSPVRIPCANLTQQSLPYPTPPSFEGDPQTAAASLLAPKCPLSDCPFEAKNRCWNCCWCGKARNNKGRCGCIMLIDGNQVRCEHICCFECEAASLAAF